MRFFNFTMNLNIESKHTGVVENEVLDFLQAIIMMNGVSEGSSFTFFRKIEKNGRFFQKIFFL